VKTSFVLSKARDVDVLEKLGRLDVREASMVHGLITRFRRGDDSPLWYIP
jgi:hypothetical protein